MILKNMALGLGISTLATFTALPSIGGSFGNDTKLSNVSPTGIYASNDETDDDEDDNSLIRVKDENEINDEYDSYFIDKVFQEDSLKTYMDYIPDLYDEGLVYDDDFVKHLENEDPDAFEDMYLRELAEFYGENHELHNCKYETIAYGSGLGFGDYAFTQGFYFIDDPESPWYMLYFVKATPDEVQAHVDELSDYYHMYDSYKDPESGNLNFTFIDDETGDSRDLIYYTHDQILSEQIFEDGVADIIDTDEIIDDDDEIIDDIGVGFEDN